MGSKMDLTKEPKILIVGGGMAGISAAKQLIAGGMKDVTILEAKERLGGRIHTINHGDKHLEIGAQWIHGEENNPLYEMAAANNMVAGESDSDTDSGSSLNVAFDEPWENQFFTQDGRRVDPEIVRETCLVLDGIFSEADKFHRENKPISDENESMGTFVFDTFYKYLRTTGYAATAEEWRVREALFQWRLQEEAADCGCKSLYEMSAGAWGEFRECQGEDVTLLYGYQALLNLLLADIPMACVRLNAPVQCVYWDQQHPQPPHAITTEDVSVIPTAAERKSRDYPVAARTKSGELLPADHVIFTSSLGVLKKSAHYLFKPILPRDKMAAIHRLGFGTVDKVYLEWEKPWWSKDMHAVQLAWMPDEPFVLDRQEGGARSGGNDEWYRGLHAFERVDYQPHLLLGWVAGAEAEVMETLPEADVLDVCHQVLVKFTGKQDMPKPVRLIRSKWGHDAYTSGSYSYIRVGSTGQDMDLLAQPLPSTQCPHLLFAGEATHPQYFSTVHGALESGQREARRLLQYYNNSTK